MHADHFRHAYDAVRATGFAGSRAQFAALVLANPSVFRGSVVAAAKAWERERGAAPSTARRGVVGLTAAG